MKYILRKYQEDCIRKMEWGLTLEGNSLIVIAQGGGKSLIQAEFAHRVNKDVLILQPSKELLEQNMDKMLHYVDRSEIGVYSASMNEKTIKKFTFATIQSAYKNPELFKHIGVVIIDECLIAGTKVDSRKIEDIKVGDHVNSFNHKTQQIERKKVLAISKKELKQNLYLTKTLDNSIISTSNHPLYVKNKGYIDANKVKKGDIIYANRNISKKNKETTIIRESRVVSSEIYKQRNKQEDGKNSNTTTYVYNLQVEDNNNYFANNILVHNCDLVPVKQMDSMYRSFLTAIGNPQVFGMTGTPYRVDVTYKRWGRLSWMLTAITTTKMITRMRPQFWHRILYVLNTKDLQEQGYLSKLTYKDMSIISHDQIPTNKTKSEFDLEKFEGMVSNDYSNIAKFIENLPHKKTLVFCSSVQQANELQALISSSEVVTGETPAKTRHKSIQGFRDGSYKVLLGCNIFTVGFDVPDIDSIVVLRPTKSLRLWSQLLGRGARISEGKETCMVYDFVDNVRNLGTFESIEVKKIDLKWNVVSDAKPEGFHMFPLFEYQMRPTSSPTSHQEQLD